MYFLETFWHAYNTYTMKLIDIPNIDAKAQKHVTQLPDNAQFFAEKNRENVSRTSKEQPV